MYDITFDRSAGVLRAVCGGFWSVEEANRYCAEMERWTTIARREAGAVRLVLDFRTYEVQSPQVIEALGPSREHVLQTKADRIGLFMNAGLGRMQVRRLVTSDQTRVFATEEEARTWVLGGQTVSEAA